MTYQDVLDATMPELEDKHLARYVAGYEAGALQTMNCTRCAIGHMCSEGESGLHAYSRYVATKTSLRTSGMTLDEFSPLQRVEIVFEGWIPVLVGADPGSPQRCRAPSPDLRRLRSGVGEARERHVGCGCRGTGDGAAVSVRLLVCGSRAWTDRALLFGTLDRMHAATDAGIDVVIHGGAKGADTMAGEWATEHDIPTEVHTVYPHEWKAYGKAAGIIRNARMLRNGKPTVAIAFAVDLPNSRGTADMVRRLESAGIPTDVVDLAVLP